MIPVAQRLVPLWSLAATILCQLIGFAGGLATSSLADTPLAAISTHAAIAWAASILLQLPVPWQILNLIIFPAFEAGTIVEIPPWWYGTATILLLLVYIPTFWTRVPFYPTPPRVFAAIAELLPADRPFRFIDLGCGFGRLLAFLAKRFPNGEFVGAELGILPTVVARLRTATRRNVTIRLGSFWRLSLADFDCVYAFLAPPPMAAIEEKTSREMRPGSLLIVNSFPLPKTTADEQLEIDPARGGTIFLYRK